MPHAHGDCGNLTWLDLLVDWLVVVVLVLVAVAVAVARCACFKTRRSGQWSSFPANRKAMGVQKLDLVVIAVNCGHSKPS